MTEHPPRHQLEELLVGTLHAPDLRAHLAACERCSERLRNMEAARAAFVREHSASDFACDVMASRSTPQPGYAPAGAFGALARKVLAPPRPAPRRKRVWAAVGGGVLALAAAVLFMLHEPRAAIRYRGAAVSMQAYVQHGTGVHTLHDGVVLSGGTQLAFAYTLSEPQHLLLFGIDDAGTITRYFPDGSIAQSSALPAGAKRQLPVGIELDARRGRERLIALFSKEPLDQEAARGALESAWRKVRADGKDISEPIELALPAKQISLWFDKR